MMEVRGGAVQWLALISVLFCMIKLPLETKLLLQTTEYFPDRRLLLGSFLNRPRTREWEVQEEYNDTFSDNSIAGSEDSSFHHIDLSFNASTTRNNSLLYQQQTEDQLYIFYHIYIPSDPENALSIIEEQLHQVGNATADYKSTAVFYNTIGNTVDPSFMNELCQANNLQCHHLNHYTSGFEFITLQDIHNFCSITSHQNNSQNHNVVYMHSKGSFHSNKGANVHLRRSMTTAVVSRECHMGLNQDTCDTCGLIFSAVRTLFYPGNFWTAQCRYVNQLLDPFFFADEMEAVIKRVKRMRKRGKLTVNLFPERPFSFGRGRYAAEFWAGSHPSIRPCDVASNQNYTWGYFRHVDASFDEMELHPAPRENISQSNLEIPTNRRQRFREYYLLAGYIMKWMRFYDQAPPDNSWIWKFFPDGEQWKKAVKIHGKYATVQMVHRGVRALRQQRQVREKNL